jgi:uncharacterized protein
MKKVVVLGASDKADRYSYQAVTLLHEKGYTPLPVHPTLNQINGIKVYHSLNEVQEIFSGDIHTLSLYVNPSISSEAKDAILKLHPQRVIFNPGTENPELENALNKEGIETKEACTLVMLRTGQF